MVSESIVGTDLGFVSFPVDGSKVMEMAKALHDDHPAYRSEEAAHEHGFPSGPAPLTVTALSAHWNPRGAEGTAVDLGMDLKRLLHGETTWDYMVPVSAGDTLTSHAVVTDVTRREGKRGGQMTLVTIQTDFTNQNGVLAIRQRDVLIEREA